MPLDTYPLATRLPLAIAQDTFTRANQSGFGTASDGESWTTTGSGTLSIVSNAGSIASTGSDTDVQLGTRTSADSMVLCQVTINNTADIAGVQSRYSVSSGNITCYKLLFYSGNVHLNKAVAGTNSQLTSVSFTMTPGTAYWFRLRILGSNISGNVWQVGTTEPTIWMSTVHDTSVTGSGGFAILGNTATSSSVQYTHFVATSGQVTLLQKDIAGRLHLSSGGVLHALAGRFLLSSHITAQKEIAGRIRYASGGVLHALAGRLHFSSGGIVHTVVSRIRLSSSPILHALAGRLRFASGGVFHNVAGRLRFASSPSMYGLMSRIRLSSSRTFHPIVGRFRFATGGLPHGLMGRLILSFAHIPKSVAGRLHLSSGAIFHAVAGRLRSASSPIPHAVAGRLLSASSPIPHAVAGRFRSLAFTLRAVQIRLLLILGTNTQTTPFRVHLQATAQFRAMLSRLLLQVTAQYQRDLLLRLVLSYPSLPPDPLSSAFPSYNGTGGMFPILAPTQSYIINTLALDLPSVCTAPMTSNSVMVPVGSQFALSFTNPSPLTQALLTSWTQVTMTFFLYTGEAVTGLVGLQVTQGTVLWQVLCTTLVPIQVQRWKVQSQFP